jgi:hypothetical protein
MESLMPPLPAAHRAAQIIPFPPSRPLPTGSENYPIPVPWRGAAERGRPAASAAVLHMASDAWRRRALPQPIPFGCPDYSLRLTQARLDVWQFAPDAPGELAAVTASAIADVRLTAEGALFIADALAEAATELACAGRPTEAAGSERLARHIADHAVNCARVAGMLGDA